MYLHLRYTRDVQKSYFGECDFVHDIYIQMISTGNVKKNGFSLFWSKYYQVISYTKSKLIHWAILIQEIYQNSRRYKKVEHGVIYCISILFKH